MLLDKNGEITDEMRSVSVETWWGIVTIYFVSVSHFHGWNDLVKMWFYYRKDI